jgi:hypothetical protein
VKPRIGWRLERLATWLYVHVVHPRTTVVGIISIDVPVALRFGVEQVIDGELAHLREELLLEARRRVAA